LDRVATIPKHLHRRRILHVLQGDAVHRYYTIVDSAKRFVKNGFSARQIKWITWFASVIAG